MGNVFISYSRDDVAFVRQLKQALENAERSVWVDLDDIPPSAQWMAEINRAIEAADAVLFVLSPSFLASDICALELDHSVRQSKRLVPVVLRDIAGRNAPDALSQLNWLFFRSGDDFEAAFSMLIAALDTDLDWVRAHTRLLTRAVEWETAGRSSSALLRGGELSDAESLLADGTGKEPPLNPLQREYVLSARKRAKRVRAWLVGTAAVAVVLAVIAGVMIDRARERALIERSRQLVTVDANDRVTRLLVAVEAVTSTDSPPLVAHQNLIDALYEQGLIPRIDVKRGVKEVSFSADGRSLYAVSTAGDAVRQWDIHASAAENPFGFETLPKPRARADLDPKRVLARIDPKRVNGSVTMAARALRLAATGKARSDVGLWDLSLDADANARGSVSLMGRHDTVAALSRDGRWLVTRHYRHRKEPASVWDLSVTPPKRVPLVALSGGGELWAATFSDDGEMVATSMDRSKRVLLWSTNRLSEQAAGPSLLNLEVSRPGNALAFDRSGDWLVAGKQLWKLNRADSDVTAEAVKDFHDHHPQRIDAAAFSADGEYLVTAGLPDGRPNRKVNTRLWRRRALQQESLELPHYDLSDQDSTPNVIATAFSPDGQWLVTATRGNPSRIHLWPIPIESMVIIARRHLKRNFSSDEWNAVFQRNEPFDPDRPFGAEYRVNE